ncbi:MAG: hypothetical protein HDS71_09335 [Bacteroidales bacterium]|nr:hypothetical protein [Bacteroidales bacterium]
MKTATVYFSCGDRCNLNFTDIIRFTTSRGAKIAFRNAIRRNFTNAAAIYGNFAHCKAEAVEGCNTILTASFTAGYFA